MACDVCGKIGETEAVTHLLATKEIQHICSGCARIANRMIMHFRQMAWLRTKRRLTKMRKSNRSKGESS